MFKQQIRTTQEEGTTSLFTIIKIEGKSTWVDLRLIVDIEK